MLVLDGVYIAHPNATVRFRWVKASISQELTQVKHAISQRVGRFLERDGLLERDAENNSLASDTVSGDPMNELLFGAFPHLSHCRGALGGAQGVYFTNPASHR